MSKTYSLGLTLTAPTKGDTNWAPTEDAKNTRLSMHDHSGGGLGTQIAKAAIASDAVDATKIRLGNNTSLRARNVADNADVNLFKLDTDNELDILTVLKYGSTETITSGAISVSTTLTILNNSNTTFTLAAGSEGQLKVVYSAGSNNTINPAAGASFTYMGIQGISVYYYTQGAWRAVYGQHSWWNGQVTTNITADGTYSFITQKVVCNKAGALAVSLSNGVEGLGPIDVVNIGAGTATITPTTSAGANTATITTNGYCTYKYLSGEWRAIAGNNCTLA